MQYLALVDDLLTTAGTFRPQTRAAEHGFERWIQVHFLETEQLRFRHELVTLELGVIFLLDRRRIGERRHADIQAGRHPDGLPGARIGKQGGDLAQVLHPQRAMTHGGPGGDLDAIGEATIGLDEDQGGLVWHGSLQSDGSQPGQTHAHAQHLARAEMVMAGGTLL